MDGAALARSGCVAGRAVLHPLVGGGRRPAAPTGPLRLVGTRLYLDRYWRQERQIVDELPDPGAATPA